MKLRIRVHTCPLRALPCLCNTVQPFLFPQPCTGTRDTQGVITITNHFPECFSPPPRSVSPSQPLSLSDFPFFLLCSAPYRTELVYISIRGWRVWGCCGEGEEKGGGSCPEWLLPQTASQRPLKEEATCWTPVSQAPFDRLCKKGSGGGPWAGTRLDLFVIRYAFPLSSFIFPLPFYFSFFYIYLHLCTHTCAKTHTNILRD